MPPHEVFSNDQNSLPVYTSAFQPYPLPQQTPLHSSTYQDYTPHSFSLARPPSTPSRPRRTLAISPLSGTTASAKRKHGVGADENMLPSLVPLSPSKRACQELIDPPVVIHPADVGAHTPPDIPRNASTKRKASRPQSSQKRPYSARQTNSDKLNSIFDLLARYRWSLGHFLFYVFKADLGSADVDNSLQGNNRRCQYAEKFLSGETTYTPSDIIDAWFHSPYGAVSPGCDDEKLMYRTNQNYLEIKAVRPALSSFAAQIVRQKLLREATTATKPANGLQAFRQTSGGREWMDIGATTVRNVSAIIQTHQPLTWDYATAIASGVLAQQSFNTEVVPVRKTRPIEPVCAYAISALLLCRNRFAQRLALATGLYEFASGMSYDAFAYNCHIGASVAWSTVCRTLEALSKQEKDAVRKCGRSLANWGVLVIDNVQNYLLQRDPRIGRANTMNIGIAATYVELLGVNPQAHDFHDKLHRIQQSSRKSLTVDQLLGFIDHPHLDRTLTLHWLYTLVKYIPELEPLRTQVSSLFRTRVSKIPLPAEPSKIHPLATSGKNETVTTELKDALVDFMEQLGQTVDDHQDRLMLICGDGLTYEKILQQKKYLSNHSDSFQSMQLVKPVLAPWHTIWTDLSRLYETHYGEPLSRDPASLGHSATQIGRLPPSNLKKVDYYPYSELAYLVLDIRMLDCWRLSFGVDDIFRHFQDLASQGQLPNLENLESLANQLHRAYSSTRGILRAMSDVRSTPDNSLDSQWASIVPLGSQWKSSGEYDLHQPHAAFLKTPSTKPVSDGRKKTSKKTGSTSNPSADPMPSFHGDHMLAKSIAFMRDALVSREAAYATAEGDVGRLYEVMKFMLFSFAGSSHSKYVSYLLEAVTSLELESSLELREAVLRSLLVNLTGLAGSFCALDFMQEYFNRLLQAIVQRKGVDYGASYVRDVISRNLHHLGRIKKEFREGVGLQQRSGHHKAPHLRAEVKVLLNVYKKTELHSRRPGRHVDGTNTEPPSMASFDNFSSGIEILRNTKLPNWLKDHDNTTISMAAETNVHEGGNGDSESPEDSEWQGSLGNMFVHDGELIIDENIEDFAFPGGDKFAESMEVFQVDVEQDSLI